MVFVCRGIEQIRTAVGAFAELCLATRPRYRIPYLRERYLVMVSLVFGQGAKIGYF